MKTQTEIRREINFKISRAKTILQDLALIPRLNKNYRQEINDLWQDLTMAWATINNFSINIEDLDLLEFYKTFQNIEKLLPKICNDPNHLE